MSSTPTVFRSESQPSWGQGIIVDVREGKSVLLFEHAGQKVFKTELLHKVLTESAIPGEQARALEAALRGVKKKAPLSGRKKKKVSATKGAAAAFGSFEEQLACFDRLFPAGGFHSVTFIEEERGRADAPGKLGYKEGAIARARAELAPERFTSESTAELFETARRLLSATNIAFPIEGAIPFSAIAEGSRAAAVEGIRELLHGEGAFGTRFDAFVRSIDLKDKTGKAKRLTWPTATLFAALYAPQEHVAVKPTAFSAQAATLGHIVATSQPVTAVGYARFLDIAKVTREKLEAAGHKPRDLMDVYSFIWRTHYEKPR